MARIFAERKRAIYTLICFGLIRNECSRMSSIKGISKHLTVLNDLGQALLKS